MFQKSFIYKRNSEGPRIQPWGTLLLLSLAHPELICPLLLKTLWYIYLRHVLPMPYHLFQQAFKKLSPNTKMPQLTHYCSMHLIFNKLTSIRNTTENRKLFIIYLVIFLCRWHNITMFRIVYHRSDLNVHFLYILCAIFVFVDNCIVASCFLHCCDGSHIHRGVTSWRIYGEQINEWMNECVSIYSTILLHHHHIMFTTYNDF
jgi:hypothetical protein